MLPDALNSLFRQHLHVTKFQPEFFRTLRFHESATPPLNIMENIIPNLFRAMMPKRMTCGFILPKLNTLVSAACLLISLIAQASAIDYFTDSFANNSKGWTLGTNWAIGSATSSSGQSQLGPDPSFDNTPTSDNGVAGYGIGGNTGTALFAPRYLTSPVINLNVTGSVMLEFYRWLNSDYPPYSSSTIEVWNGSSWVQLYISASPGTQDTSWTRIRYDVTPYKNSNFRVRFGVANTGEGVWSVSSWNIDDLRIFSAEPEITVEQPVGTDVPDGGTKNFGTATVGASTNLTFTIKNTNIANLTGLTITKDGANPGDFVVTASPTAPVSGPSGSTTFTVQFTPGAAGTRTAAIHIANNDSDENPFDINLTGTGILPPTVTSISPSIGSTAGGTSVTITGTGFTGATGVTIGGTAATGVTVVSATTITCTTPARFAGAASVLVTTPGGTNAANTLFTYVAPPTVTSISPNIGSTAGGGSVTITGTGFIGVTDVTIGGNATTGVTVVNATTITCNTPAGVAGTASVLVTTPGGTNAANALFTYNTPPTFAGPYPVSTAYQTAATVSLSKILTKAADADGDARTVTAAGPSSAQGGTAVLQSGSILYTPPNGFSGSDSFTITITDARGATVQGTVSVTVGANPNSGGQGVNPPQLTVLTGGDIGISFQGIPGRSYQIQRSPDMTDGSWQTIATVTAASNGAVTFTDDDPPPGAGYYRMRIP
jgi:hypothetical protein